MSAGIRDVGGDVAFFLGNNTFHDRRELSVGSDWNKILLGIHFNFVDSGANATAEPLFYFGLVPSRPPPAWPPYDYGSCRHFIGIRLTELVPGGYITREATSPISYASAAMKMIKVGTTVTDYITGTYEWYVPTTNKAVIYLLITKGTPNFSFECLTPNAGDGVVNISSVNFVDSFDYSTINEIKTFLGLDTEPPATASTIPIDEATNGAFTTVVYGCRGLPEVQIFDIRGKVIS